MLELITINLELFMRWFLRLIFVLLTPMTNWLFFIFFLLFSLIHEAHIFELAHQNALFPTIFVLYTQLLDKSMTYFDS